MTDPSTPPCVLVVADPERVGELVASLSELPSVEVLVSSGGDDTIDLFVARRPAVVVLTASLSHGDAKSLIVTLRGRVPRAEVAIVVIGDDAGSIRTALDALDLAPDRFVTRPLSPRALRFAVTGGIDAVRLVRSSPLAAPPLRPVAVGTAPGPMDTQPGGTPPPRLPRPPSVPAVPPPLPKRPAAAPLPRPTAATPPPPSPSLPPSPSPSPPPSPPSPSPSPSPSSPAGAAASRVAGPAVSPPLPPPSSPAVTSRSTPSTPAPPLPPAPSDAAGGAPETATRAALRARWEALADSMMDLPADEDVDEPTPVPSPLVIKPRRHPGEPAEEGEPAAWKPGSTDEIAPPREPTLILREPAPAPASPPPPEPSRTPTGDSGVVVTARTSSQELWSEPMAIPALADRAPRVGAELPATPDLDAPDARDAHEARDIHDEIEPALALGDERHGDVGNANEHRAPAPGDAEASAAPPDLRSPDANAGGPEPRDFARELRAKMSMMAQRLFQGGDAPAPGPADHAPRHDHHTEIDLAALGDEPPLAGMADLEGRAAQRIEARELATSPGSSGSWDTQVSGRGLPDRGPIVRGASDAAMLLAKMFAQGATGRIAFRRDELETVVYFDHGRPVFASSNEPRDRMGLLLLREGKITASQYERCQTVVAESGRRMGEILVDFGYLKRRELLPAVRRHVEDLVYSLFGWERGTYAVTHDAEPCAERIRLSRHPAALILEGIRRKLDRTSLERLIGPPSTVIEVRDRDRLGGIVHMGDLAPEERGALAAFDGQADLASVARTAGIDIADVLPLAWGLCVLGLATARRTDTEAADEATALIGETDLAIDRERVRARWQLVTEADYFALLGVRRDATGFEIRRAYQSARRDFAADCFPGDLRRELARELDDIAHVLDEAFRVLRDDRLRQTYLANLVDR